MTEMGFSSLGAVSLVVQHEEPPYQHVVVEGTVVETAPSPKDVL